MKDQHKHIKGYRDLTQSDIDAMNAVKEQGNQLREMLQTLSADGGYDARWLSIAETHLQQGIMAAVRAIAQPEGF